MKMQFEAHPTENPLAQDLTEAGIIEPNQSGLVLPRYVLKPSFVRSSAESLKKLRYLKKRGNRLTFLMGMVKHFFNRPFPKHPYSI